MDSTTKTIIARITALLDKSEEVLKTHKNYGIGHDYVDKGLYASFRSQALTCLVDTLGPTHPYTLAVDTSYGQVYTNPDNVNVIRGVLQSFKQDLENGYLKTIKELIHAEVFVNFIEMAESLVAAGYKDAAAVVIGALLETHLRELATKNGISITALDKNGNTYNKKASALNDELAKARIYSGVNQKQVLAWLGLRNDAAHGAYQNYTKDQVALMVQGVTAFLSQFPA